MDMMAARHTSIKSGDAMVGLVIFRVVVGLSFSMFPKLVLNSCAQRPPPLKLPEQPGVMACTIQSYKVWLWVSMAHGELAVIANECPGRTIEISETYSS